MNILELEENLYKIINDTYREEYGSFRFYGTIMLKELFLCAEAQGWVSVK